MSISRKNILLIAACLLTVINIYSQYTHSAYKYYVENIEQLRNDFAQYRKSVNGDIIKGLFELTNICANTSSAISGSIDSLISSNTNMPMIVFDRFAISRGRPCAIIGDYAYYIGDIYGKWVITDINPSYVVINDNYYYYQPQHNRIAKHGNTNR